MVCYDLCSSRGSKFFVVPEGIIASKIRIIINLFCFAIIFMYPYIHLSIFLSVHFLIIAGIFGQLSGRGGEVPLDAEGSL